MKELLLHRRKLYQPKKNEHPGGKLQDIQFISYLDVMMGHHESSRQRSCGPKHLQFSAVTSVLFCRLYKLNMKSNQKSNIDLRFKEAFEIFISFSSFVFVVILFLCSICLGTQSTGKVLIIHSFACEVFIKHLLSLYL